jgi:hypothetical protein
MRAVSRGRGGAAVVGVTCLWLVGCGSRTPIGDSAPSAAEGGADTDSGTDQSATAEAGTDSGVPSFPLGAYKCDSSLDEYHSAAGGSGTLTITQAGSVLTATYAGDYAAEGALQFVASTGRSANPVASGQTFGVLACVFSSPSTLGQASVTSGSLTVDAQALFLSIVGTLVNDNPSTNCPAQQSVTLSLLCTKG